MQKLVINQWQCDYDCGRLFGTEAECAEHEREMHDHHAEDDSDLRAFEKICARFNKTIINKTCRIDEYERLCKRMLAVIEEERRNRLRETGAFVKLFPNFGFSTFVRFISVTLCVQFSSVACNHWRASSEKETRRTFPTRVRIKLRSEQGNGELGRSGRISVP